MAIELKRKEVAEKYDAAFDADPEIIVQGLYRGPLSNVTLTAANRMIRTKTNLLVEKKPLFKTKQNQAKAEKTTEKKDTTAEG